MDERAEIWIARDPDTNAESKPVSLRKLRKGVRIGRLQTTMLVKRADSTAWVTLERLLADAATMTPTPAPAVAPPSTPVEESVVLETVEQDPRKMPTMPPQARLPTVADPSGEHDAVLTAQWFNEPIPEPDDDEPIFVSRSWLDLSFERVMTTKLVRLTWILLIATLAMAVFASFLRVAAALAAGNGQQIATAVAAVPVVVLGCAVVGAFGRMLLEVLLAIFRISDRMSRIAGRP
jgi:hypothetical protein